MCNLFFLTSVTVGFILGLCLYEHDPIFFYNKLAFNKDLFLAIIGFYGAIVAFFMPLSMQMITSINKQFETERIAERFKNENVVRLFPIQLLVGIFVGLLGVLLSEYNNHWLMKTLIIAIFLHGIYVLFQMAKFKKILENYTNTDKVLKMLQEELNERIS